MNRVAPLLNGVSRGNSQTIQIDPRLAKTRLVNVKRLCMIRGRTLAKANGHATEADFFVVHGLTAREVVLATTNIAVAGLQALREKMSWLDDDDEPLPVSAALSYSKVPAVGHTLRPAERMTAV